MPRCNEDRVVFHSPSSCGDLANHKIRKERFSGVITIWSSRASQLMAQSKKGSSCVHLVLQLCERQFGLGA
jgi:hypothetical protein